MKIFLRDQSKHLAKYMDYFGSQPIMQYERNELVEKVSNIDLDRSPRSLQFLDNYRIFPDHIMVSLTQWDHENRKMQIGDNIVQQVYIPPTKYISQKIIFGVRVTEIIEEPDRHGFSYETLRGHVEKGISTFTVEDINSVTSFKIHTFSTPGNFITKLLGPFFSVPYQAYCTKQALLNVKNIVGMHGA